MDNFFLFESFQIIAIYSINFTLGLLVIKYQVKVNYTRKIFALSFMLLTMYLVGTFPFESTPFTTAVNGFMIVLCLMTMAEPFRKRCQFLNTAFTAINRPEDQPYTLLWLPTELLMMSIILFFMQSYLSNYEQSILFYIIILTAGFGDGLAEPIGVRFGKHKYNVRSLVSGRKYTRSIEGSLCIFVTGLITTVYFQEYLTADQFILAICLIPITMTLAEAFSPHTWDGPFLYFTGSLITILILEVSPNANYAIQVY